MFKQYISPQCNWKYPTKSSSFGGNGCGCCAIANLIKEAKGTCNLNAVRKYILNHNYAVAGQGTRYEGITNTLKHYGFNVVLVGVNDKMTKAWNELNRGNRMGIILFRGGSCNGVRWTNGGHYVAFTKYKFEKGKHYFKTEDSGPRQNNGWHSYEETMKGLVYMMWIVNYPEKKTDLASPELYYHSDQKKSQCVIASMVNAMRRRQVLHNGEWKDITITNAKKQGARQGNYECEFHGTKFKIHYDLWTSKGTTEEKKKADLIARLREHPAGVCIHGAHTSFAKSKKNPTAHGVLITEYKDGTFYGVNPSHNGKRYGYSKTSGKGIETIKAMNMTDKLMKYTRISYLEVIK